MATPAIISVHNPENDNVTTVRVALDGGYNMHTAFALPKFHATQEKANRLVSADTYTQSGRVQSDLN